MKLFVNWKKKYEEMKELYDSKSSDYDILMTELKLVRQDNITHDEIIKEKNEEIEEIKRKLDILYAYYDLDKEATQEIKTKIRTNERVWELELEVAKLKAQLTSGFLSLAQYYNPYANSNICQQLYPFYLRQC